jgi:pantetheine-phosphate adenylyltransferase
LSKILAVSISVYRFKELVTNQFLLKKSLKGLRRQAKMSNIAIYPGSFDPFTNGHLDIVKKGSKLFDQVHIIIGVNANKKRTYDSVQMKEAIEKTLEENNISNCRVFVYEGLVAEYTNENSIGYMIRGLRNNMDYNYEENIAEVNKLINPNLEYVYFRAENVALSSSMVKELSGFGKDVSKFVPKHVLDMM